VLLAVNIQKVVIDGHFISLKIWYGCLVDLKNNNLQKEV